MFEDGGRVGEDILVHIKKLEDPERRGFELCNESYWLFLLELDKFRNVI